MTTYDKIKYIRNEKLYPEKLCPPSDSIDTGCGYCHQKLPDVSLNDILKLIQLATQNEEKDCVNYHTNKYQNLSLSLSDVSDKMGFIDIDLSKEIKNQSQETLSKLIELVK